MSDAITVTIQGVPIRFDNGLAYWDAANASDREAAAGEIQDYVTVTSKENGQQYAFTVPNVHPVPPGTWYTSQLEVTPAPPDGEYEIEVWFNGSSAVMAQMKCTIQDGKLHAPINY